MYKIGSILFLFFFLSISPTVAQRGLELEKRGEIELTNDIKEVYQSSQTEFDYIDGKVYFMSHNPNSISGYYLESGEQFFFENLDGSGPYEMRNMYDLTIDKDENYIFLLDYTGKIVGFDLYGRPKIERVPKLPRAKNILPVSKNLLIAQEALKKETYFVRYDLDTNQIFTFGPRQEMEDVLFSVFKRAGVLLKEDNKILAIKPFGKKLYIIDSDGYEMIDTVSLKIPGFKFKKAQKNQEEYLNNPRELRSFFAQNSTITGIFKVENNYVIETLHMHNDYQRALALLDESFNVLCSSMIGKEYDGTHEPKIRFSDGENIFFYREELHEDSHIERLLSFYELKCK